MASEHVVTLSNADAATPGKQVLLDYNNGYLYDKGGNQIGRLGIKDSTKDVERCEAVSRFCANDVYGSGGTIACAMRDGRSRIGALKAGEADKTIAMDLGFADVHQAAPLPNYAAGYRNEAPIADMFSPPLLVNVQSGKYYTFNADDAFQSATPLVGAPAGTPSEVTPRLSNSTFTTSEYAIGAFVATQIEAAADAPLRIRVAAAKRAMNAMMIARENRVATLATTSGNWNGNNVVTLGGTFQWNQGSASDPVKDIHARIEASIMRPTGILMNPRVWHNFVRNPAVQKFFAYKSNTAPIPSPSEMGALLELPPIYVGYMRMKNSSGVYDYLWPDACVLVRQPERMPPIDQEDIATSVTFRWNTLNAPAAADVQSSAGGFIVREFFNQVRGNMGGSQVVVLMHDVEVMTATFVGGLILGVTQ